MPLHSFKLDKMKLITRYYSDLISHTNLVFFCNSLQIKFYKRFFCFLFEFLQCLQIFEGKDKELKEEYILILTIHDTLIFAFKITNHLRFDEFRIIFRHSFKHSLFYVSRKRMRIYVFYCNLLLHISSDRN